MLEFGRNTNRVVIFSEKVTLFLGLSWPSPSSPSSISSSSSNSKSMSGESRDVPKNALSSETEPVEKPTRAEDSEMARRRQPGGYLRMPRTEFYTIIIINKHMNLANFK
ncbi:hypothetical protein TYRP_007481 [Tyrophagus putrescentiae]|nr:hypothetical protein TYRP_007481 [Tyrophagus putrescentiae]